MNDKKFCFIICSNNESYLNECMYYLNQLEVPDGHEIDVLSIQESISMASGYNEGMNASDARYKIYLHHDLFILNRYFLRELLRLFSDKSVGMIGMVGSPILPDDCIMWCGERVGSCYEANATSTLKCSAYTNNSEIYEVEAIDGMLMATQYDLPWREDLFTHWDYYDISQSFEFRKHGYKVIVPKMDEPWCLHDCGVPNYRHFYEERIVFINNYKNGR